MHRIPTSPDVGGHCRERPWTAMSKVLPAPDLSSLGSTFQIAPGRFFQELNKQVRKFLWKDKLYIADQEYLGKMTTPSKTPPGDDPKQLERTGTVREIGSQAVWSLSSCKPGFGVDQLRDDNLETYWQSDGSQPHLVNIQFRRKTTVKTLCIYADYKSDESYTPSKVSVRVGNNFHDLKEMRQLPCVSHR
ncbi:anaphase-promoting complex subunit 10 isoform X2 [Narcine bancroftii]|uniref:anaphase-promoting complex subunit 10 isoform X2 n=1 Tax=Narcine bancroftii TaxID=1343680 RepID=UPI0038312812